MIDIYSYLSGDPNSSTQFHLQALGKDWFNALSLTLEATQASPAPYPYTDFSTSVATVQAVPELGSLALGGLALMAVAAARMAKLSVGRENELLYRWRT